MTTKDTTIYFSSILSSIKNPEPMTSFDFMILAFAFFANRLQIDFQSAFLGWCSIRIAKMVSKSMNWLSFRRFTNELFGGVCLGFIRSRGRLRPSRKPPETTKKKSRPSLSNRCSFVLAIAILSIAFYSNSNLIRNAISGHNQFNFSGDQEVKAFMKQNEATTSSYDTEMLELQLNSERLLFVNYLFVPARAMSSNPDISTPLEPISNDDANQLPALHSDQLKQIKQFSPFHAVDNQPYLKQNDPIERNNPKPMPGLRTQLINIALLMVVHVEMNMAVVMTVRQKEQEAHLFTMTILWSFLILKASMTFKMGLLL